MDAVDTGRALGSRYALLERLGSGAMGEVWRALDRTTGEHVAAKLLRREHTRDPQIVARFVQERTVLLSLRHPNVVRVRDLVVEGDDLAIVMDLVVGSDLRQHLRDKGTLPPYDAVVTTTAVLDALAAAHAHGCLHRDVKPDNVLLGAGPPPTVLLSDFGIARLAQETTVKLTGALGTPEYMAPEVFVAEQSGGAADVYAAGVLLYELLAGRTPFAGGTNGYAIANRHVTAAVPPLDLPPRLSSVLLGLLAKDPTVRLSASGAAAALRELLPALGGLPPLPVQQAPDTWGSAPAPERPELLLRGGGLDVGEDVGATRLKGAPRNPAPAETDPLPAGQPAVVAAAEPLSDEDRLHRTQVVSRRPAYTPPVLAPDVPAPTPTGASRPGRARLLAGAGALAAVAAVAAAVLLWPSGGADQQAASAGTAEPVTAVLEDPALDTGLTVSREAVYDPKARSTAVTVTWTAGRTALQGPFYENVPGKDDCPLVAWREASLQPDATEGLPRCGWRTPSLRLAPGQSRSATYDLAGELDDPDEAVDALLRAEAEQTTAALTGLPRSAAYPVQRLVGVEVQVPSSLVSGQPVPVRLLPLWQGVDTPDALHPLFDSARTGPATQLLTQVAGGLPGLRLNARGCDALGVDRDLYPYATHQAAACQLEARLGDLPVAASTPFAVVYRPS